MATEFLPLSSVSPIRTEGRSKYLCPPRQSSQCHRRHRRRVGGKMKRALAVLVPV